MSILLFNFINNFVMTPVVAEFVGTFFLLLLGNGVVANVLLTKTKGEHSGWIVITTAWALAVFCGVSVSAPYSGGHVNPIVTLSFATAGLFPWDQVVPYIIAQVFGAFTGAWVVYLFYYPHFKRTTDSKKVLETFCTVPAIKHTNSNLLSEIVGSFTLVFVVLYFSGPNIIIDDENAKIGLGTVGIMPVAFLLWVIGLSLGGTTGPAINPARDFTPRLLHQLLFPKRDSQWNYALIPILGPIIGGMLAAGIYLFLH